MAGAASPLIGRAFFLRAGKPMMILNGELWTLTADNAKMFPQEINAAIQRSIDDLTNSKAPKRALTAGDTAPDFALPDTNGRNIVLSELLHRGPVVVSFYRGGWCPYCCTELRAYQAILRKIQALGAELVAISPQTTHNSTLTAAENGLSFALLSDPGGAISEKFRLNYVVPAALRELTQRFGRRSRLIGTGEGRVPMPATYVIAPGRIIVLAGIDADFRRRLEPSEVLTLLRSRAEMDALGRRRIALRDDLQRQPAFARLAPQQEVASPRTLPAAAAP